jgi:hypothetical protein
MTTTTKEPEQGTDTRVELDVDLNAEPACEMGEQCVGEHGPAVARLLFEHRCDHREVVLICGPCLLMAIAHMMRFVPIHCPRCQDEHVCLLAAHCAPVQL